MSQLFKDKPQTGSVLQSLSDDVDEVDAVSSPIPTRNESLFRDSLVQFYNQPNTKVPLRGASLVASPSMDALTSAAALSMKKIRPKRYAILAISDALTDVVINITDEQLSELGLTKGASFPISSDIKQKISLMMDYLPHTKIPGGSPTNTIYTCSNLGLRCAYVGCVGSDDDDGYDYINTLRSNDIDTYVSIKKGNSAICYTFITPDAQRSFGLDFGVTKQLEDYEILHSLIEEAQYLHFSAYELRGDTSLCRATMHAVSVARHVGTAISIDMGDAFLIPQCFEQLMKLFKDRISIIFANEDEANAFCECHAEWKKKMEKDAPSPSSSSSSPLVEPLDFPSVDSDPSSPSSPASPSSLTVVSSVSSTLFAPPPSKLSIIYGKGSAPNPPPFPQEWLCFLKYTELLIVKRGDRGSIAITDKGIAFYCPAYKVEGVLDTNGAGDNFQAGFFYGLFRGLSIPVSLKIGSFIASRVIRRRGAQPHVQISGVEYLI